MFIGGGEINAAALHPIGDRGPRGFDNRHAEMRAHRTAHHFGIVGIDGFRREQHDIDVTSRRRSQ